jgi:hypothetical protein
MPSYTYGNIQDRIADELDRPTDIAAQIKLAIISAIEHYETERFPWAETIDTSTLTTTSTINYVTPPTGFVKIDKLQLTLSSYKYDLARIGFEDWANKTANATTNSQPTEYTEYAGLIYLYPTPNSAYVLPISYVKRLATLSATSDANGWTNFAEELIRHRAKGDILCNIVGDDMAMKEARALSGEGFYSALEKIAYMKVRADADGHVMVGRVKGRYL